MRVFLGHSFVSCLSFLKKSLYREAYVSLFLVNCRYLNVNNLTYLKNVRGLAYLFKRDLRDVDKSVNAVNYLCKCAEGHKAYYLNRDNVAYLIVCGEDVPRVSILGLVSERNSLLFCVEFLDEYRDLLSD